MKKTGAKYFWLLPALVLLFLAGYLIFAHGDRLQMTLNQVFTYIKGSIKPAGALPPAVGADKSSGLLMISISPDHAPDEPAIATEAESSALPNSVELEAPRFDLARDFQDWNNCGPATLALALRYWGWDGDQYAISRLVKPSEKDKNVNMEELAGFVNQSANGLRAEIRVGGDLDLLKRFLSAGYPVVVETGFNVEKPAWPGDDLWVGHYLLLTGYTDDSQSFTAQDTLRGPGQQVSYSELASEWAAFNQVYLVVFPAGDLARVRELFGVDWSPEMNAKNAAARLESDLMQNSNDAFAWFALGTNLNELQRFDQADAAFDKARELGLPQRMLRYQFGPLAAAYALGDQAELQRLADYALKITPESEEVLFWKGQALLMIGNPPAARSLFERALQINPGYHPAQEALTTINP